MKSELELSGYNQVLFGLVENKQIDQPILEAIEQILLIEDSRCRDSIGYHLHWRPDGLHSTIWSYLTD